MQTESFVQQWHQTKKSFPHLTAANKQIRELQSLLGKKTMEAEILKETVEFGRAKK